MAHFGVNFLDARGPEGMVVYAIGDVHGRLDLLTGLHAEIAIDRARRGAADWRIVHLGDYVDRGPQSRGVIDFLVRLQAADRRILSLAGNHDRGMLDFLAEPDANGIFVRFGGVETALSYGVALDPGRPERLSESHRALVAALPESHVAFLKALTYSLVLGDFFFCHAGVRPGVALDAQDPLDLIWIRQEFHRHAGLYSKVIVHGHTPTAEPEILANRVNVDTGAYATGVLTALVIDGAEKTIMSVGEPPV